MKIVAFNSSPRDNATSKTELILQKVLEGARQAGASTETVYLRQYKINDCLGCFSCWIKNSGRCVQKDDMSETLFECYLNADLVVLATPIYHMTMNAQMKRFIERTMPMGDPLAEVKEPGDLPYRFDKVPKVAAVSVCGFPGQSMFQALSLNLHMICGRYLVAEIYRHSSEALTAPPLRAKVDQVLAAAVQAGAELVRDGRVGEGTMAALTQDLAPPEEIQRMGREFWLQARAQGDSK
jgi:multimeric flavodoxin WrbA